MSRSETTYQIEIIPNATATKDQVIAWLLSHDISFVEGVVEGIDIDFNYDNRHKLEEMYDELSEYSSLLIYKYDADEAAALGKSIQDSFGGAVTINQSSIETKTWTEGWKQSFKPVETDRFYIYPPWETPKEASDKILIEIEPGMAFGTGNHATTLLCLGEIEKQLGAASEANSGISILDVGTGSGILAIALKKFGYRNVYASDIDSDAIIATKENCQRNQVSIPVVQGGVVDKTTFDSAIKTNGYDILIANILFPVLRRLMPEFASALVSGGKLIVSGVTSEDQQNMQSIAEAYGFTLVEKSLKDDWVALCFIKS